MKRQFPKIVTMNELNQLDWEVDKERLQTHALTVMEGLGAAVESLDDTEFLNNVLFAIGQSHGKRRIKPQMLQKLWPALDYGLGQMLGVKYNKETAEAWRCIYMYIKERMSEGIKVSRTDSQSKKDEQLVVAATQKAPSAQEESTLIESETEAVS